MVQLVLDRLNVLPVEHSSGHLDNVEMSTLSHDEYTTGSQTPASLGKQRTRW